MNRLELISQRISFQPSGLQKIQIEVCTKNNIGYITLNSPKDLNSLSEVMIRDIGRALNHFHEHNDVNVIVIRSSHDKIFCAGADIKMFTKYNYEQFIRNQVFNNLEIPFAACKKPVIAAVNGKALGGGFELAMLCDIILASDKAYFALPEVNLGLMPGIGGTQRLTKIIGQKMAMRFILTAEGFNGKKASDMNVSELVQKFACKISSKAVSTMMIAKRAVKFATNSNLAQGLQFQKSTFYPMLATKGAKQGISAFFEKRKPNFKAI